MLWTVVGRSEATDHEEPAPGTGQSRVLHAHADPYYKDFGPAAGVVGKGCTAYWHHPRYSSGWHGTDPKFIPPWDVLYANDVDLVLNGHDHDYERFRPMTPTGKLDTLKGITEIVAGTGGEELRGFNGIMQYSDYRIEGRAGVLLLTLGDKDWRSA